MEIALDVHALGLFNNPNKAPLNKLYITFQRLHREGRYEFIDEDKFDSIDPNAIYKAKTETVPALDKHWVIQSMPCYEYQKFYPEFPLEENEMFIQKNIEYLEMLQGLLDCTFHQFWCHLLFLPEMPSVITNFISNRARKHELGYLEKENFALYDTIRLKILEVYRRMLVFKESDELYLEETVAFDYLKSTKLLSIQVIVGLIQLYGKTHRTFVEKILNLYFSPSNKTHYSEQLTDFIDTKIMSLEMIGGNICGFETETVVVSIGIGPKPKHFDPYWIDDAASFLFDLFSAMSSLFPYNEEALEKAYEAGIPHRITYLYERAYAKLYYMLYYKQDIGFDWRILENRIYEKLAFGRAEAIESFQVFIEYLLRKIEEFKRKPSKQQPFAEKYVHLLTTAFEDNKFMADYNKLNPINDSVDLINNIYPEIDKTRTDYLKTCLKNLPSFTGNNWVCAEPLYKPKESADISLLYDGPSTSKTVPSLQPSFPSEPTSQPKHSEEQIRQMIDIIQEAMPHLGDGFILQCLQYYDHNVDDVFSAIIDENLPPHLKEIPFDTIIIPPEPEPAKPILAYKGKKPEAEDVLEMLDDKLGIRDIKELVVKRGNVVDADESDDDYEGDYYPRKDEAETEHFTVENPNRKPKNKGENESSSDESEESPEEPSKSGQRLNFCQDPAFLREMREAKMNAKRGGKSRDVVGKPRGQGQEKNVQQNRDHKNANKSSRANHNRKKGAQWKKSRGMMPM